MTFNRVLNSVILIVSLLYVMLYPSVSLEQGLVLIVGLLYSFFNVDKEEVKVQSVEEVHEDYSEEFKTMRLELIELRSQVDSIGLESLVE